MKPGTRSGETPLNRTNWPGSAEGLFSPDDRSHPAVCCPRVFRRSGSPPKCDAQQHTGYWAGHPRLLEAPNWDGRNGGNDPLQREKDRRDTGPAARHLFEASRPRFLAASVCRFDRRCLAGVHATTSFEWTRWSYRRASDLHPSSAPECTSRGMMSKVALSFAICLAALTAAASAEPSARTLVRGPDTRRVQFVEPWRPGGYQDQGNLDFGFDRGRGARTFGYEYGPSGYQPYRPRVVSPVPVRPELPPAWTAQRYAYCAQRYRSFDPDTGTYMTYGGERRLCR